MKSDLNKEFEKIWSRVISSLKYELNIDEITFNNFFASTYIYSIKNNQIIVACPSQVAASILSSSYKDQFLNKILESTGTNYSLIFVSQDQLKSEDKDKVIEDLSILNGFFNKTKLNENYTFNTFIEGICNKEARHAGLVAATNPGKLYNPLYIQGNSGVGKTHLLNAIGNLIKEQHPELNVLYTSSTEFMEEYVNFVKGNTNELDLPSFIKKFDCLLIDDIQQLKDKTKTLDFFFDIYQAFYNAHKQIVITSDRYQNALEGIPDRLVTRFLQGLTVSINLPDIETSKEVLKLKFKTYEDTLTIDDDVINLIAENFQDSIRSLEGILNRLTFYSTLTNSNHIDLALTKEALQGQLKSNSKSKKLDENKIIVAVSDYYHISQEQLKGKLKTSQIANARQIAIYLIRTLLDLPYKKIGKLFSNRDHSTIMHSYEKVEKEYHNDPQIKEIIDKFNEKLKN